MKVIGIDSQFIEQVCVGKKVSIKKPLFCPVFPYICLSSFPFTNQSVHNEATKALFIIGFYYLQVCIIQLYSGWRVTSWLARQTYSTDCACLSARGVSSPVNTTVCVMARKMSLVNALACMDKNLQRRRLGKGGQSLHPGLDICQTVCEWGIKRWHRI